MHFLVYIYFFAERVLEIEALVFFPILKIFPLELVFMGLS